MADSLETMKERISVYADEILEMFKPGAKIMVCIAHDEYGDCGLIVTNDDPELFIEQIRRGMADPQKEER